MISRTAPPKVAVTVALALIGLAGCSSAPVGDSACVGSWTLASAAGDDFTYSQADLNRLAAAGIDVQNVLVVNMFEGGMATFSVGADTDSGTWKERDESCEVTTDDGILRLDIVAAEDSADEDSADEGDSGEGEADEGDLTPDTNDPPTGSKGTLILQGETVRLMLSRQQSSEEH